MKKGRKLSEEIIDTIKKMRSEGYKISYICKALSVNKNTVVKYTKRGENGE